MSSFRPMPPPDARLRRNYEAECDCGQFHIDSHVRSTILRRLAKHRSDCDATVRFHRTVTVVWEPWK